MAKVLDSLLGNKNIAEQLLAAAAKGRLHSSLLLVGPTGVGRKKVALCLAQALVCEQRTADFHACGQCPSCLRIEKEQSENLLVIKPTGGLIKIDQAHQIIKFLSFESLGKSRFVLIESADTLNPQAANALLKSIEEPPKDSYFLIMAPSVSSVLPTIRSRSQVIRFSPLPIADLKKFAPNAPEWVYRSAQGRTDMVEMLMDDDQRQMRELAFDVWENFFTGSIPKVMESVKDLVKDKGQCLDVIRLWQQSFRDAWLHQQGLSEQLIHQDQVPTLEKIAQTSSQGLDLLFSQTQELEHEVSGHLERSLCLEAYFLRAKQLYAESGVRL